MFIMSSLFLGQGPSIRVVSSVTVLGALLRDKSLSIALLILMSACTKPKPKLQELRPVLKHLETVVKS